MSAAETAAILETSGTLSSPPASIDQWNVSLLVALF